MKKILALGVGVIMSVAVLFGATACDIDTGKGDGGNGGDDDTNLPVETPDINLDADVSLTVGTLSNTESTLMQRWINNFQKKYTNVSITITKTMGGMPDVTSYLSAGDLPDIIWTAGDQHAPYSGSTTTPVFQDLSDEEKFPGSAEFFSGFYESLIDSTHYDSTDNGIWFVPRDYNRLVIYINKTAFDAAHVAVPDNDWTWEEFLQTCSALKTAGAKKAIEWKAWFPVYYTMLRNYGGDYLNDKGELILDSTASENCFNFYKEFYSADKQKGLAISGQGENFTAYSPSYGIAGAIPMIVDVRPQLPTHLAKARAGSDEDQWELVVRSFPNFVQTDGSKGYVGTGCSGYGITTACKDETKLEWAWKFLQWCMSEEGYDAAGNIGNLVPSIKALAEDEDATWRNYSYNGYTLDEQSVEAFVDTHTNDLSLNYAASLAPRSQDDFINNLVKPFWESAINQGSYSSAISTFKTNFQALITKN